jgi:hypothetical protein
MLAIEPIEIKSTIRPPNFCLFFFCFGLCLFILTSLLGSIIPTSWLTNHTVNLVNWFGSFFLSANIINYVLTAKSILTVDERGILIKITKIGLGLPIGETFYEWSNLVQYSESRGRGEKMLFVEFASKKNISFSYGDGELYTFLKTHFPEKERP